MSFELFFTTVLWTTSEQYCILLCIIPNSHTTTNIFPFVSIVQQLMIDYYFADYQAEAAVIQTTSRAMASKSNQIQMGSR